MIWLFGSCWMAPRSLRRVRHTPAADGRPPLLAPDAAALRSGAIVTAGLAAVRFQPEIPAIGSVVDPVDLAETRAALATAESLADKARADLEPARAEAERQQRLQTLSYFYRADDDPMNPRFIPGLTVSARLAANPARDGVAVPAAAVVQREGRSWVYVEETPGAFRRREVAVVDELPDGAGWFQGDDRWRTGETVVVAGAALLLGGE